MTMLSLHKFSHSNLYKGLKNTWSRMVLVARLTAQNIRPLYLVIPMCTMIHGVAYAEQDSWMVNLQDADIKAFINEVGAITNQNFALDPRINGNVTVISHTPLTKDEIYQLFLSVMRVNGITAIEKKGIIEIIPENTAKQTGIEVDLLGKTTGSQIKTRVYYLSNIQASEVLTVIRPLMPQSAHAAAVPGINALVLSDYADSLNQLGVLIEDLDSNSDDTLSVINLRHVSAERMLEMINSLTGVSSSGQSASQLRVVASPDNDRLLVRGNPKMIAKVTQMVNQIDVSPSKRLSGVRTFPLKYADAKYVADTIRALLADQSINVSPPTSNVQQASLSSGQAAESGNNTSSGSSGITNNLSGGTGQKNVQVNIIADERRNAVIVNARPERMSEIEEIIQGIDVRPVQVLIQAAIVEVSGNDAKQLGVQWALGNADSGYGVVNFNNSGASLTSLATAALGGKGNPLGVSSAVSSIAGALLGLGSSSRDSQGNARFYGAVLQALDSTKSANLLSMPSILTLNNSPASILVGQNVPFVTGSYTTTGNSVGNPFQTIDRQDVGISLNVIPHVGYGANGEESTVRLEISQEVSSVVDGSLASPVGLTTNKSALNTTILAKDQETVALGGLMRDNSTTGQQKVPGLGNIPVIGRLFRSDRENSEKSNLIIFLQPTILRDSGAVASITERKYDQIRVMQLVIDNNGTIKKIPLSDMQKWQGGESSIYELMSLDPISGKNASKPSISKHIPAGFTKVNKPTSVVQPNPQNQHNLSQSNTSYSIRRTVTPLNNKVSSVVTTVNEPSYDNGSSGQHNTITNENITEIIEYKE